MELEICEIFSSFQGEGVKTGIPTTFVRMSGCNLDCVWCDTRYSTDRTGVRMEVDEVMRKIDELGMGTVCITGGEPLFQPGVDELIHKLLENGYGVDIETNGSIFIAPFSLKSEEVMISMDVKTPSSGSAGTFDERNLALMRDKDQLKFIISDEEDMDFALEFIEKHHPSCSLIFTPVSNTGGEAVAERLKMFILSLPRHRREHMREKLRLMVQTHKVIWESDRRGV